MTEFSFHIVDAVLNLFRIAIASSYVSFFQNIYLSKIDASFSSTKFEFRAHSRPALGPSTAYGEWGSMGRNTLFSKIIYLSQNGVSIVLMGFEI